MLAPFLISIIFSLLIDPLNKKINNKNNKNTIKINNFFLIRRKQ
jgi:hypothetical protein